VQDFVCLLNCRSFVCLLDAGLRVPAQMQGFREGYVNCRCRPSKYEDLRLLLNKLTNGYSRRLITACFPTMVTKYVEGSQDKSKEQKAGLELRSKTRFKYTK
jgi:hypothetical protein